MTGDGGERWRAEVDARLARLELRADEAEVADGGFAPAPRSSAAHAEEYPQGPGKVTNTGRDLRF